MADQQSFAQLFAQVFRDFKLAGVPASGANEPEKHAIRAIGAALDLQLAAASAGDLEQAIALLQPIADEATAARDVAQVEANKIVAVRSDAFTPNLWPDPELAAADGAVIWHRHTPSGAQVALPVTVKNGAKAFATPLIDNATGFFGPIIPIAAFPSGRASIGVVIREKLGDQGAAGGGNNIRIRLAALTSDGSIMSTANWPSDGNDRPQDRASYYTRDVPRTDIVRPTTLIIAENLDLASIIAAGAVSIALSLRIQTNTVQAHLSHGLIRDGADPAYKGPVAVASTKAEAVAGVSNAGFMTPATAKIARDAVVAPMEESVGLVTLLPNQFSEGELATTSPLRSRGGGGVATIKNGRPAWVLTSVAGSGAGRQVFMGPFFKAALGNPTKVSACIQVLGLDPATSGSSRVLLVQSRVDDTEITSVRATLMNSLNAGISDPTWFRAAGVAVDPACDRFYLFVDVQAGASTVSDRSIWFADMMVAPGANPYFRPPPAAVSGTVKAMTAWAAYYNSFPDALFANYGATWGSAQGWANSSGAMVTKGGVKTLEIPPTVAAKSAQSARVDVGSYKSGLFSSSIIINEKLGDQGLAAAGGLNNLRLRLIAYDAAGAIITGAWAGYAGNEDPSGGGQTYYTKMVPRADISRPLTIKIAEGLPVPAGVASIAVNIRYEGLGETASPAMYVSHICIREGEDATWNMPPASNVGQGYLTLYLSPTGSDAAGGGVGDPLASGDKAMSLNNGVGEIVYLPGDYSQARARINNQMVRDLVISGMESSTFGRPLVRGGVKLAGVTKTAGRTKVYEAPITLTEGAPNFIWEDGVNDDTTLVPATERHAFLRGRSHRLTCVRIVHVQPTEAGSLTAALTLIDASAAPRCYYDAAAGKMYFSVQGGGDAMAAAVYVSAAAGFFYNGPAFWAPAGRVRIAGIHTRYTGINLRGFRSWEGRDCSVLGGFINCFDVAWRGRLVDCEGMGSGSGNGPNGDCFNAHNFAVWEHENCYGHDGWDDGWSSHENCVEVGVGSLAEYNAGNGFIPAYGAQAVGRHLISRKNAVSPFRPGWKIGGFSAYQNPTVEDNGGYTSYELHDCRSYGDKVAFHDSATSSSGVTQAFMKAMNCVAQDAALYGYQCSSVEDCRYVGSGTPLAPGVTATKSVLLG